ncbi:urokinase plasminogen activator surface receptor-like, partial [Onychostoma macrolepis]|uniref:urokinase plasminogen activator surface receptor-like n=1 Tax=Onychostoma macrolepis TaxID=369639 RepID=UPI00272B20FD
IPTSPHLVLPEKCDRHSFSCYQCSDTSSDTCVQKTCSDGLSSCFAATAYVGEVRIVVKSCSLSNGCPSGSVNLGNIKASSSCCNTDLCNTQDAPDPNYNSPNGKTCYYCDGQNCSNILNCSGSEDRCITETGTLGGQLLVYKGCVSKSICDATTFIPVIPVSNFTCCEGNLCNGVQSITQSANGAQSVTQSFLFLCCSLLSFILMH